MILFIGGPVDWGMGRGHGRHGWGYWIPWERLRDSPELRDGCRDQKLPKSRHCLNSAKIPRSVDIKNRF